MRALDGWYAPRFLAFSERKATPVSEPFSPPAASNAKPLGGSWQNKAQLKTMEAKYDAGSDLQ